MDNAMKRIVSPAITAAMLGICGAVKGGDIEDCRNAEALADTSRAVSACHRLADQGDALAQFSLGFMYDNGRGVPQDYAEAVKWYQAKLANLLKLGVGAIKADFGEGAPLTGQYASGRSGWYEHNLYPLRYNKAVADITRDVNHENIIWARSAWAGSQRYPLHWGGDSQTSDIGMASTLRGGLCIASGWAQTSTTRSSDTYFGSGTYDS